MIEDKLTQEQRIRLEAYAQVNATSQGSSIEGKIDMTDKVAAFIETGKSGELSKARFEVKEAVEDWFSNVDLSDLFRTKGWDK